MVVRVVRMVRMVLDRRMVDVVRVVRRFLPAEASVDIIEREIFDAHSAMILNMGPRDVMGRVDGERRV